MEGKRPGGLTALAVINFVFSAAVLFRFLGAVAFVLLMYAPVEAVSEALGGAEKAEEFREKMEPLKLLFTCQVFVYLVTCFLLIASGVGYLKLNRTWGWFMGNLYAVLSISGSLLEFYMVDKLPDVEGMHKGGLGIGTILNAIYPILTLILLNTTFKEDFRRRPAPPPPAEA